MFRYSIHLPNVTASFCTMSDTVAYLDKWRVRVGWLRVTAFDYFPLDDDSDGLTPDERECVNEPPGPVRDALVARIDAEREVAA